MSVGALARRFGLLPLAAATLVALVLLRFADPAPVARLRLIAFDTLIQIAPRRFDPDLPVRIVDIDEASLARHGQWPWPRQLFADLVGRIAEAGAVTVAIDMVLPEPERGSIGELLKAWPKETTLETVAGAFGGQAKGDVALAAALARMPAVLGFTALPEGRLQKPKLAVPTLVAGEDPRPFLPGYGAAIASLPALAAAAKSEAALNWLPEHDLIVRRVPLAVRVGDTIHPTLSAEAIRLGQGSDRFAIVTAGAEGERSFGTRTGIARLVVGNVAAPTDANGQLWLYPTPTDRRRFVSAAAVLDGSVPAEALKGRIVLIGTSAAGLFDLRATALDPAVAGVEIHAQAIEQMASGAYLSRPDYATGVEVVLMVLLGAALIWLALRTGAAASAIAGGLLVAAVLGGAWVAFRHYGLLIDPVFPVTTLTGLYIVLTLGRYLNTEVERNRIRGAFRQYLAPALVEELARNPDRLKLGGEMREVTILFTDVRSFSSIAERLEAEALTRFLNRLLTPLSDAILATGGTIDKYIGDAIMAFWNAPLDDPAHPRNATRAALEMLGALEELNRAWAAEARADGRAHEPVRIGIGLNTALCCVGNLGSTRRFDYSVIGDGVNLASRIEGRTKLYGVPAVAGESVRDRVPDLAWLEIDYVSVKGRSAPVRIYALLGSEAVASGEGHLARAAAMKAMLEHYRGGRFEAARASLAGLREIGGAELGGLCDLYAARIARLIDHPPPADWDGRENAEEK